MYTSHFPNLTSSIKVGNLKLKSRMCSAPMGFPDLTEDGCLTEGAIAFYERKAKGGAAIVTVSEALPDYENGNSHARMINLQNPAVLPGLTNAARAIKRHGAIANIELGHSGAFASGQTDSIEGASSKVSPEEYVSGFSKQQISDTVKAYAKGAALVKRAGFDMVMVHAGHGWLLHQFLSPMTNKRADEYGGGIENRARFLTDIIDAIKQECGQDFPVEVRISAVESGENGISLADSVELAKILDQKVDLIHVSAGGPDDFYMTHPSMFTKSGVNVDYAAEIKKHVSIPVAVVGALNDPQEMEDIIGAGKADLVCMARALVADPDLPKKVEQNRTDEILHCLRCLVCHAERALTQTRICALNPEIGREYEAKFTAVAAKAKKVLVVGGGPGGLQCALTAAERGHQVTLCEKSGALGGNLRCEIHVPFKEALSKYISTMSRRLELADVEVRLNTEVTPEFVKEFEPDALMIAVGAESLVLPLPGMDSDKVVLATHLEEEENRIGKHVAVLGGGMVGCESGLYLAMKGHEVTIVEMLDDVAGDTNPRHRPALMELLNKHTAIRTGLKAIAVTDEGLKCIDKNGAEVTIPADTVLSATGLRPREEVVDSLRNTAPIVEIIGDCIKPDIVRGATFRAYHAALDL